MIFGIVADELHRSDEALQPFQRPALSIDGRSVLTLA